MPKKINASSFRKLIDVCDKRIRSELVDYYIIDTNRMENLLWCLETGKNEICSLRERLSNANAKLVEARAQIRELKNDNAGLYDLLKESKNG